MVSTTGAAAHSVSSPSHFPLEPFRVAMECVDACWLMNTGALPLLCQVALMHHIAAPAILATLPPFGYAIGTCTGYSCCFTYFHGQFSDLFLSRGVFQAKQLWRSSTKKLTSFRLNEYTAYTLNMLEERTRGEGFFLDIWSLVHTQETCESH